VAVRRILFALWKRAVGQDPPAAKQQDPISNTIDRKLPDLAPLVDAVDRLRQTYKGAQDEQRSNNRITWAIGGVAVLVAAAAVGAAIFQWSEMRKASATADTALKEAKKASEASDRFAADTLSTTRAGHEHAYRAWLTVRGMDGPLHLKADEPIRFGMVVQNTGRSPAQAIRVATRLAAIDAKEPIPVKGIKAPTGNSVLGPGQTLTVPFESDFDLTQVGLQGLRNRSAKLYFLATLTYSDLFAGGKELRFCFFYDPPAKIGPVTHLGTCAEHNNVK
jgi:hypothetical protein